MILLRSRCFLAACVCILAAPAFGQAKTAFDPARDLPGFETARSSEYKDLFPVDKYSDLLGNEMDKAALEKTKAEWAAESGAVQKHLDEIGTNPKEGVRWLLSERMKLHPFFSKIGLTVDDTTPPFLIFVQKPAFDDPAYAPGVVKLYQPFLVKAAEAFDARVAKTAGVTRRADKPWIAIAILASSGDMQNYDRLGGSGGSWTGTRHDDALDLIVGWVNSFDKPKANEEVLWPILRETCYQLLDSYAAAPAEEVASAWLQMGLADALAFPRAGRIESMDAPEPRASDLRRAVEACHDANTRNQTLFPLAKMAAAEDWDAVVKLAFGLTPQPTARYQALSSAFQAVSGLWMHFLLVPENGKHRASFKHYLEQALKGVIGTDALASCFPGRKLEDLDREFWSWVYDQHKRVFPDLPIDRSDLTDLFAKPVEAVDEIAAKARASLTPDPAKPPEPPFDPALLAVSAKDVEAQHGMALLVARTGDFEGARTALTALAATGPAVPYSGQIARDLARLEAAIHLRDNCLEAMTQKGQRLNIERDGKKLSLATAKIEKGEVIFADNKSGLKSIPVTAVDPVETARLAERKELVGDALPWARGWILLLAGDAKWDKSFKVDADAARDLREDGNVWFADRQRAGQAALILDALSKKPLPKTSAEAEPTVKDLETLTSKYGTTTCVLFRKSGLARLARAALDVMSVDLDPALAVRGKVTKEADGRIKLSYDFKDPAQLEDFVKQPGYLGEWRKTWKPLPITEEQSTISITNGTLHLRGDALWRLPLGFAAPLSLEVDYRILDEKGKVHQPPTMAFLVCDDAQGDYTWIDSLGYLTVYERTGETGHGESVFKQFFLDRPYKLKLVHDGKRLVSTRDGEKAAEMQAGTRPGGGVVVLVNSELEIVLERIEIVGKPDPASLVAVQRAWADRKMAAMGF